MMMIQEQSTEQRTEAVIEAVVDAAYPYWRVNGQDVRAALISVHQDHPVPAIRAQAWASHQFVIDAPIGERAHELAMLERQAAERGSAS